MTSAEFRSPSLTVVPLVAFLAGRVGLSRYHLKSTSEQWLEGDHLQTSCNYCSLQGCPEGGLKAAPAAHPWRPPKSPDGVFSTISKATCSY